MVFCIGQVEYSFPIGGYADQQNAQDCCDGHYLGNGPNRGRRRDLG